MSSRHPDWEARLHAYLAEVRGRGWDPVVHNCAMFALGGMRAVLQDADERFATMGVEMPDSALAAARVLKAHGGVRGLAHAFFGSESGPILRAGRGDVVIANGDGDLLVDEGLDDESLGIFDGSQALFVGTKGLQHFPLTSCTGCWKA